jgi:hypothetical protein
MRMTLVLREEYDLANRLDFKRIVTPFSVFSEILFIGTKQLLFSVIRVNVSIENLSCEKDAYIKQLDFLQFYHPTFYSKSYFLQRKITQVIIFSN